MPASVPPSASSGDHLQKTPVLFFGHYLNPSLGDNDTLLRAFDQAVKKKRKVFEENLDTEFEKAKGESGKNLEHLFSERSKLNSVKRFFFGSSVKEQFTETRKMGFMISYRLFECKQKF